jgi:hypothetical protein
MVLEGIPFLMSKSQSTKGVLQPFHGFQIPGICFDSGHCIWLLNFTETPTNVPAYFEVWLISPDDDVTLFVDQPEAIPEIKNYHMFDNVIEATIDCELPDQRTVDVRVTGEDGTTLDVEVNHERTRRARLLTAMLNVTPRWMARSRPGAAIGTATLNFLLPANGLRVAGRTETGQRYRNEPDRLTVGTDASAILDGEDLGMLSPPDRSIAFGDLHVPEQPIVTFGDLYLAY